MKTYFIHLSDDQIPLIHRSCIFLSILALFTIQLETIQQAAVNPNQMFLRQRTRIHLFRSILSVSLPHHAYCQSPVPSKNRHRPSVFSSSTILQSKPFIDYILSKKGRQKDDKETQNTLIMNTIYEFTIRVLKSIPFFSPISESYLLASFRVTFYPVLRFC